jgi:bleomycin hydrolase
MTKNFNITFKNLKQFSQKFNNKRTNKVFKNVNTKVPFHKLVIKSDYVQTQKGVFDKKINIKKKITDQEKSGRCWIFAFLNVIRIPMIKKYNLEENFEFSQNYLFFYDKLEKANAFFNYVFDTKKTSLNNTVNYKMDTIKLVHLLDNLTNDGGTWCNFCNLINKYGAIPKTIMNDKFHSKNSKDLNTFYNNFLRKSAKLIRNSSKNKDTLMKELLGECYKILVLFLGEPPKTFTWDYYEIDKKNKDKKNQKILENITPLYFYKKYVPYDVNDKICLINYPCKDIPYYKKYNLEMFLNVIEGIKTEFINVPMKIIVKAIKKSINNEEAVWCGVDVNKFISKDDGFLDTKGFNYTDIFGFNNIMDKCDGLNYRQSNPTHAFVIEGYNHKKGNSNGFLIENSWGNDNGFKGNYYMSEKWFNLYGYIAVVDKKFVSSKELNVMKQKPVILPFWNPFGNLLNIK